MRTKLDMLIRRLSTEDFEDLRTAFIHRSRMESNRADSGRATLLGLGYIEIPGADQGQYLTDDGRPIVTAFGRRYAMPKEEHQKMLDAMFAMEKERKAEQQAQQPEPQTPPTVCRALIDGQLCGGTLVRAAVCPRCAMGKSGVTATLTCDVCGHVSAIMGGDS